MQLVSIMATKISNGIVYIDKPSFSEKNGCPSSRSLRCIGSNSICPIVEFRRLRIVHLSNMRLFSSSEGLWHISGKPYSYMISKRHAILCRSNGTCRNEVKECSSESDEYTEVSRGQREDGQSRRVASDLRHHEFTPGSSSTSSNQGLAEACKFVSNDAKFVNEKARNDMVLLSRGITTLNNRARQDVAVLGLGFLKLDARAREDTEKIDHGVRSAAHIHYIATGKAHSKLKSVADQHWSDGALEADLRRANFLVRRRAMEDAFMALKFVKRILDLMANKQYQLPQKQGYFSVNDTMGIITLEKNGKALDLFAQEISTDRVTAIQNAYCSMTSALSEADGIDYTDPEELEWLVATLIDLDAIDGKRSVSLLAECSSSPDVSTRQALANALAAAPSIWILGNAGMGALQRLAEDSNPAVAAAASKAISELKQQWELEEGDSLRFMMNQYRQQEDEDNDTDFEADIS